MAQVPVPSSVPKQYRAGYPGADVALGDMQDPIPGLQHKLAVQPLDTLLMDGKEYQGSGKLQGKNAVVTGGDSGIGRATAILFAKEGASVFIHYHPSEQKDADNLADYFKKNLAETKVYFYGVDLVDEEGNNKLVEEAKKAFGGKVDVLFNNASTQVEVENIADLPLSQWDHTFAVNMRSMFILTKAFIPMMPWGASIIFNSSINPFVGHPGLLDYTATKGSIVAFSRALSNQIVKTKGIRVNCVNPGPIWTPLVVATMTEESLKNFGPSTAIGRAGQPVEIATCCVFLASADSSYVTAQCIHANGGSPY